MKRVMMLATLVMLAGCQAVQDVKEGVEAAPQTFWDSVKEVTLFVADLLISIVSGWLQGALGWLSGLFN